jgi:hypothetical protein
VEAAGISITVDGKALLLEDFEYCPGIRALRLHAVLPEEIHDVQISGVFKFESDMKQDIIVPKNSQEEIEVITSAFFAGKKLEMFYESTGNWQPRLNNIFPNFHDCEYRIAQEIPEGYKEVDYRKPKKGDTYLGLNGFVIDTLSDLGYRRRIILEKVAPEFEVGQVWLRDGIGGIMTREIVAIACDEVCYLFCKDGIFVGFESAEVGDLMWEKYKLKLQPF